MVNGSGNGARSGAQTLCLLCDAPERAASCELSPRDRCSRPSCDRPTGSPARPPFALTSRMNDTAAIEKERHNRFPGVLESSLPTPAGPARVADSSETWLGIRAGRRRCGWVATPPQAGDQGPRRGLVDDHAARPGDGTAARSPSSTGSSPRSATPPSSGALQPCALPAKSRPSPATAAARPTRSPTGPARAWPARGGRSLGAPTPSRRPPRRSPAMTSRPPSSSPSRPWPTRWPVRRMQHCPSRSRLRASHRRESRGGEGRRDRRLLHGAAGQPGRLGVGTALRRGWPPLIEADSDGLELGGDGLLARTFLDGLHEALFELPARSSNANP